MAYEIVTKEVDRPCGLDSLTLFFLKVSTPEGVHCVVEKSSGVTRAVFFCYDEASQYIDHLIAH